MLEREIPYLSPWETASNQDEWPHPVASPGILTDNLRHPLSPGTLAISPGFRAKPQLSSVFVIKRNHPELNLVCLSLSLPLSLSFLPAEASQNAAEISHLFSCRDPSFRSWDNSPRGIRGFSPRVAPCRSSWISNTSTTSPHRRRRPSFFGVRKNTLEVKKEK